MTGPAGCCGNTGTSGVRATRCNATIRRPFLAARHTAGSGGLGEDTDHSESRTGLLMSPGVVRKHGERERLQSVANEDRSRLVEGTVAGGAPTAEVVGPNWVVNTSPAFADEVVSAIGGQIVTKANAQPPPAAAWPADVISGAGAGG